RHLPHVKIILLGGYYQPDSQVLVGPMTSKCGEIFFSDKFFIGADGFISDFGFTGKDHMRVQTVADLAERTQRVIVLTDAEKFRRQGALGLVKLDRVAGVYTDERIPPEAESALLSNKVMLHKVPEYEAESA
ncbi:MAG: DeoR family transcriptional regulator, partial [Treponema sp.]|nr:DeoR family transcriptional regulator [Treponema sp.]